MTIFLNGAIRCTKAKVLIPSGGSWVVDLEVDADLVPPGPAVLTIGTSSLAGSIDPDSTGSFGPTGRARLVGGLGWSKSVVGLHLHNDAGVTTTAVLNATAAEILEPPVLDPLPKLLGVDFVRSAGPASRVLAGLEWYVNELGVTVIGPRIPIPAGPGIEILNWDPGQQLAELSSTELVMPGTVLTDTRFGVATVRDVEQTFDADGGARAKAWCRLGAGGLLDAGKDGAGPKMLRALTTIAREAVGLPYLRRHGYQVLAVGVDGRLTLRATALLSETPLFLTFVEVWGGVPGATSKPVPGTNVDVVFLAGDPSQPRVVAFEPNGPPPLEVVHGAVMSTFGSPASQPFVLATAFVTWAHAVEAACAAGGHPVAPLIDALVATMLSTRIRGE